jgi:hypothetical protein
MTTTAPAAKSGRLAQRFMTLFNITAAGAPKFDDHLSRMPAVRPGGYRELTGTMSLVGHGFCASVLKFRCSSPERSRRNELLFHASKAEVLDKWR